MFASKFLTKVATAITILILTLSGVLPVIASPLTAQIQSIIYPDPPPDFSHPGVYHDTPNALNDPMFSPVGGTLDRPMLVIYVHFSDASEPLGKDLTWARNRFFGLGFPSAAGWYEANSFGNLMLFPASESQGTPNDGIVIVNAGLIGPYNSLPDGLLNRVALELADPFVNFATFDADGNGVLTDAELVVVNLRVHFDDITDTAANRGVSAGASLDGMDLSFLNVAMGLTGTNLISMIHEIAHTAVHMVDLYAFPVGSLDIAGATLGRPDTDIWSASAWSKLHWGWIQPAVVTKDGYYLVGAAHTTGQAYILYDYDRGTNDYFVVENRKTVPGTYDQTAQDDGLVIWRIDERKFNPPSGSSGSEGGPITTRQPNQNQVAWDPSDPLSPERTMTSPWRDGTSNNLAVRAIGPRGDVIQAYFDVRGPGVLVDTYPVDVYGPPKVVAGALQTIAVPVMNTGEVVDTFEFSFTGLPDGWTAVPRSVTLAPGVETTLQLDLTPAHDHPEEVVTVSVTATSSSDASVTSTDSMNVQVVHITDLAILGVQTDGIPAEMQFGDADSLTVRTQVTNFGPSWPTDATLTGTTVASAGGHVTPASWIREVPALAKGAVREISDVFEVSCQGPGRQFYTFAIEIEPTLATETDLVDTNNTGQVTVVTECVVLVAINIKPGGFPNAINLNGTAPVAVLTTMAGEYGLPFAFDATKIDPLSVRFGTRDEVWAESGGAFEAHGTGHIEDSRELDESTRDGDLDTVLHFSVQDTGIMAGDVEACIKGDWIDPSGNVHKFFGCDDIRTVGK